MSIFVKPFTFTNGTVADATEVNACFDTIYNGVNGNLDSTNIADNAIGFTEINWGTGAGQIDGTETTQWKISKSATYELTINHASLTASRTWTHPDVTDTYAGLTATQSLSNKTLINPTIKAASAVDTVATFAPYTSGDSLTVNVPATGNRCEVKIGSAALINLVPTEVAVNNDQTSTIAFRVAGDTNANLIKTTPSTDSLLLGGTTILQTGAMVKAQTGVDTIFNILPATSGDGANFTVGPTGDRCTVTVGAGVAVMDWWRASGVVINEDGLSTVDTRVETDSVSNALFIDASANTALINVPLTLGGAITPGTDASYSFGTNALRFGSMNLSGSVIWGTSGSSYNQGSITGGAGLVDIQTGNGAANRTFEFRYGAAQPGTDNVMTCGGASNRFTDVYAVSGSVNTSDRREKKKIKKLEFGLNQLLKLRPVEFKWNAGNQQTHWGFIAQEVEKAGITSKYGLIEYDKKSDRYGMRYHELIAPIVNALHQLHSEIENLKEEFA